MEVTQGWRKLHCDELHDIPVTSYCQGVGLRPLPCLLGLRIRIPPGAWMPVSCKCCVLSGKGLSGTGLSIVHSGPSVCVVSECDLETSIMRRPRPEYCC